MYGRWEGKGIGERDQGTRDRIAISSNEYEASSGSVYEDRVGDGNGSRYTCGGWSSRMCGIGTEYDSSFLFASPSSHVVPHMTTHWLGLSGDGFVLFSISPRSRSKTLAVEGKPKRCQRTAHGKTVKRTEAR